MNQIPCLCVESLSSDSKFFKAFKNKRLLKKLRKQVYKYSNTFSCTFYSHMKNEFEINVRSGKITPDGYATLDKLQMDYQILQFKENLEAIFTKSKGFCRSELATSLLDVVFDEVLIGFSNLINEVQNRVMKEKKSATNKMCSEKIKHGAVLHNFTEKIIPDLLMSHLALGLNNVPHLNIEEEKLISDIEEEAIDACKNAFVSLLGYYPICNTGSNLNQIINNLISQAPSNSKLVNSLVIFREHYVDGLHKYLENVESTGDNINDIIKLIPRDCIISQSDKNVGISILPPAWYAKEYKTLQIKINFYLSFGLNFYLENTEYRRPKVGSKGNKNNENSFS